MLVELVKMGTNDFSQNTKHLFDYNYACWETGRNDVSDYHHICGRGNKRQEIENSPLNCAPLNRKSHDKADIHSHEKQCKYLNKTVNFLVSQGYELVEVDFKFLEKYKDEYKK